MDARVMVRDVLVKVMSNPRARQVLQTPAVSRDVVDRFVAGESLTQALGVAAALRSRGRLVTLAYLSGRPVDEAGAARSRLVCHEALRRLGETGLSRGASVDVSVSPAVVGLGVGRLPAAAVLANARDLCRRAANSGTRVTLETGAVEQADDIMGLAAELRQDFPDVAVSVPAAWRRALSDCRELAVPGVRVRLVKGLPAQGPDCYARRAEVDRSYVRCLRVLLEGPGHPLLATHDQRLLTIIATLAEHLRRDPASYECQMRYGVRVQAQAVIADRGDQLRVYLPFGPQWHPYLARRIAEQPANLVDLIRAATAR